MSKLLVLVLFLAGIGLFVFALNLADLREVSQGLLRLWPYKFLFVLLLLFLAQIILPTLRWLYLLNLDQKQAGFFPVFLAKCVGFAFSYLTPVIFFGGEPARYLILREKTKINPPFIIASIILDKLILFIVATIYFFVGIFVFLFYLPENLVFKIGLGGGVFFLFWTVVLFFKKARAHIIEKKLFSFLLKKLYLSRLEVFKAKEEAVKRVEQEIANFFSQRRKETIIIFLIAGLEIFLVVFSSWLIVVFIDKYFVFWKIFAINSMTALASAIPLPAALGSLEVGQAFTFHFFDLTKARGIVFSLILRGINLLFAFIGLIAFLYFQFFLLKKRIIQFFNKIISLYEKDDF